MYHCVLANLFCGCFCWTLAVYITLLEPPLLVLFTFGFTLVSPLQLLHGIVVLLLQSIYRLQGPFVLAQCISSLLSCNDRAFSATSATLEEKKVKCYLVSHACTCSLHVILGLLAGMLLFLLCSRLGVAIFVMFVFSCLCFYCHTNTSDDTRISRLFITEVT